MYIKNSSSSTILTRVTYKDGKEDVYKIVDHVLKEEAKHLIDRIEAEDVPVLDVHKGGRDTENEGR
jgi:hypothetical protein